MRKDRILLRIMMIVVGSVVAAYGITLAIHAGFGGATLAILWQGLSVTCGITIGEASLAAAGVMILFTLFYDRKQIHIGTVLYQVIYSSCIDLFAGVHVYSAHSEINFVLMLLGVVVFSVGTGVYATASLGRGSYEAVTFALAERNHWQIKLVRMALDVLMVVLGVLLGGQFGACTIATICLSGPVIQLVNRKLKQWLIG